MPPEAVIRNETLPEGYRLTTTGSELRIEATDQSPRPLRLDRQQLAQFGLRFADDHYIEVQQTDQEAAGVIDKMLATLDKAAKLMIGKTEYKWDVENLKRIFMIIGGLDEKVVQEILDEEENI